MNDLLLELAAMAKRFSEIYEDSDFGLCAIRHGIDGPYVQLTEDAFKREFHSYSVREREEDEYRNLYAYYAEHKEEIAAYQAAYYAEHKEEIAAYQAAYRAEHKEAHNAYMREYMRNYRKKIRRKEKTVTRHIEAAVGN